MGLAGLVTVLGGMGGAWWLAHDAAPERGPEQWRPACAARLGMGEIDIEADRGAADGPYLLFGVDLSGSNRPLLGEQLDVVMDQVDRVPATRGLGIMVVSDQSERSSSPDSPIFAPQGEVLTQVRDGACYPDCEAESMFERSCLGQVEQALSRRREIVVGLSRAQSQEAQADRRSKLDDWRTEVEALRPSKSTSLASFFRKVADLPFAGPDGPGITVVLLSDLQESRSGDRRQLERWARTLETEGTCPDALPDLRGMSIHLVQTVENVSEAERWGRHWQGLLRCAGAEVQRHRYTAALPLSAYLPAEWSPRPDREADGSVAEPGQHEQQARAQKTDGPQGGA